MRNLIIFLACVLVAGCGGGGGGGGGSGTGTTPSSGAVLGVRNLPGYAVQVERLGPVQPGSALTVRATITAEPRYAEPVAVEAALQADAPTSWTAGTPAAGGWSWTFVVPSAATSHVWICQVDADGNRVESWSVDFVLAQ